MSFSALEDLIEVVKVEPVVFEIVFGEEFVRTGFVLSRIAADCVVLKDSIVKYFIGCVMVALFQRW